MFIRKSLAKRVGKTDDYTFRLVKSVREGERLRQKTLLNLGCDFDVPKPHGRELVRIIKDKLSGMTARFDDDPELVSPAEPLVRRLRPTGYQQQPTSEMGTAAQVRLDSVAIDDTRSVGCERLCLAALSALKFKDILSPCFAKSHCINEYRTDKHHSLESAMPVLARHFVL